MRLRRPVLTLLALALLATACGDDAGAGDTAADGQPERVVTLGLQWTDVVLSLGVEPVGHDLDPLAGGDGLFPWHADQLAGSTGLDITDGLPFERIAALDPDLILVAPYLVDDESSFEHLSDIAPTIAGLDDSQVDPWQEMVAVAGDRLGEPERARMVVEDVGDLMATTAEELPGLEGRTFALANYVPGDAIYVVADPDDGSSVFFQTLGMSLPPDLLAAADGVSGRAQLSLEQAGLLASDLLVVFANGEDPGGLVGYDTLPAVTAGAAAEVDYVAVVGLNTPTPLSIPYSLDVVRPALEAAAR